MPTLKHLTCNIEWAGSESTLEEYEVKYSDGYVECHVAVPSQPAPFLIHLKQDRYISPGIAMFVYIDGEYQCNRNRVNLRVPEQSSRRQQCEVDFKVRQKEEVSPFFE